MLTDYQFVTAPELPPMPACLYQYLVAQNGLFVRAYRPGLSALIWHSAVTQPVRGLQEIEPFVRLESPLVPHSLVDNMLFLAGQAAPKEILFYLMPPEPQHNWRLAVPHQLIRPGSVNPVDPFHPYGQKALIEVHSHHNMAAFFSSTDDRDESTGFRIYAVLGTIGTRPTIAVRVGIYGHFWQIPAAWVFELPGDLRDVLEIREAVYVDSDGSIDELAEL